VKGGTFTFPTKVLSHTYACDRQLVSLRVYAQCHLVENSTLIYLGDGNKINNLKDLRLGRKYEYFKQYRNITRRVAVLELGMVKSVLAILARIGLGF
jgi:hypothetical protein